MAIDYELIFRLLLAVILGGAIGWERQQKHKTAGLRTHILVCLTSTFIVASMITYYGDGHVEIARIAQAILTGIGFLGAGAIISKGAHVQGLTTAASVWCVSGLGIIIGMGEYLTSIIVAIMVSVLLWYKQLDAVVQ